MSQTPVPVGLSLPSKSVVNNADISAPILITGESDWIVQSPTPTIPFGGVVNFGSPSVLCSSVPNCEKQDVSVLQSGLPCILSLKMSVLKKL